MEGLAALLQQRFGRVALAYEEAVAAQRLLGSSNALQCSAVIRMAAHATGRIARLNKVLMSGQGWKCGGSDEQHFIDR